MQDTNAYVNLVLPNGLAARQEVQASNARQLRSQEVDGGGPGMETREFGQWDPPTFEASVPDDESVEGAGLTLDHGLGFVQAVMRAQSVEPYLRAPSEEAYRLTREHEARVAAQLETEPTVRRAPRASIEDYAKKS